MKYVLLILLITIHTSRAQQTNSRNYIISKNYKQAGANANNVSLVETEVTYLDGLGRPIQTVLLQRGTSGQNIIAAQRYDETGRKTKTYLPYSATGNGAFHANAIIETEAWYASNAPNLKRSAPPSAADLSRPFHEAKFEPSPLNRPAGEQGAGGFSAASSMQYLVNAASEVKRYDFNGATIIQNGFYAAGMLVKVRKTDEENGVSLEYTDKRGMLICKQTLTGAETLSTYYVYDNLLQLRAVLQPNYQDDNSLVNSAFVFDYDDRGSIIAKTVPGGGFTEIVYDQYDRAAMSRNANQLAAGKWAFTKYDALNRPVMQGEIASAASRTTLQSQFNASNAHHEIKSLVGVGYSLDKTLPGIAEADLLNVFFFDNYKFPHAASLNRANIYATASPDSPKGLATGSKTRVLPPGSGWLTSAVYYDEEYRVTESARELYDLGAGATERVSYKYKYDIAPVIAEEKTEQIVAGKSNAILKVHTYDHADRLLSTKETVVVGAKSKTANTLAQRYNAIGQLQSQWFHGDNAGKLYRKRTDITSNIRGWQTDGVTVYQKTDIGPEIPYFAFELSYANAGKYSNGNISAYKWGWQEEASFTAGLQFTYDDANRLKESAGLLGYANKESGVTYDKNGNIKTLNRAGYATDKLTYSYTGNRLASVNNAGGNGKGVKSGSSTYAYDGNGNMTSDGSRNATITYNALNLPAKVSIPGNAAFVYNYDASGNKLKYAAGGFTAKYAGDFEYNAANALVRIKTTAGQIVPVADTLRFDYFFKDHLGNVRVVFDERGRTLQQTEYYPFGLAINKDGKSQTMRNDTNRLLFNGKELQVGTGLLDFGSRMYLPELGRWNAVDAIADQMPAWSPYSFGFNNPLRFTDPTGMEPSTHTDEDGNVLAVYNDGDLGVYKHENLLNGQAPSKLDIDVAHQSSSSAGGIKMGETSYWDEFIVPGTNTASGKIYFGQRESWTPLINWGSNRVRNQDLSITKEESRLKGRLDIKNREDWTFGNVMTGRLLDGKYATARSAGNYLAGMNGVIGTIQGHHISGETYMKLAGAYQLNLLTLANVFKILTFGTSFGPPPFYGEETYSGRRILEGINAGNKLLQQK